MIIKVFDDKLSLGRAAAGQAADAIRQAIQKKEQARIIAATGASQFELLDALTSLPGIAWDRVEVFHLDAWDESKCFISTNISGCRRIILPVLEVIC